MRQIWEVEKDLLVEVIPLLKEINTQYPTDVFFFDVIPVTPPSMRPVRNFFVVNFAIYLCQF